MRRVLLLISVICAFLYLVVVPGNPVIKAGTVGPLALVALLEHGKRRDAVLLALALALSSTGDVLLDLEPKLFVFGLAAFLCAHISYICLFVRNRRRPLAPGPAQVVGVLLIVAYSGTLASRIVPAAHELAAPVVFYVCALTTMACTAILARFEQPWVAIGAILFVMSDSLLAINKFLTPLPARDLLVGTTYYLGQCGIALGYLASARSAVSQTRDSESHQRSSRAGAAL